MSEEDRYAKHLADLERQWEARCTCCGACCGARYDPCVNLRQLPTGKYFCVAYANRLGTQKTVSGKVFECVPIRMKLAKGESWPGDEHCGYKQRAMPA